MINKAKNELFSFINSLPNHKLEDFEYKENDLHQGATLDKVQYSRSPMRFYIQTAPSNSLSFRAIYSTFSPGYVVSQYPNSFDTLESLLSVFRRWVEGPLRFYIEDINTPDLWSEYLKGRSLMNPEKNDFDEKGMFSIDERKQIVLSLNELKLLIHEKFNLSSEQDAIVNARLDYMGESLERLNRFDWKSVLVNTMVTIGIALSFDRQQGQELYNLFVQVFRIIPQLPFLNP